MNRLAFTIAFSLAGATGALADPPISEKDRKDWVDGILKELEMKKSQLRTQITVLESDLRDAKKDMENKLKSKSAKEKYEECDKALSAARSALAKLLADPTLIVPLIRNSSRPGATVRIGSAEAIFLKSLGA